MPDSAHVVVLDDDPQLCTMVERYLTQEGLRVSTAPNAEEFWRLVEPIRPDLCVIDIRLPGEDGLSVARRLRERGGIGIIMLSARGEATDRIVGLELGADDYLPKPFELRELLARIRSVLRRLDQGTARDSRNEVRRFAGWTLDLATRELRSPSGEQVSLSTREFELARLLADRPRQVLSRDLIMNHVYHRDWEAVDRTVDVLVHQLRSKLEEDAKAPGLIRTVRGAGYVLATEVTRG